MPGTYIKLPPDGGGSGFIASATNTSSITLTVLSQNLTADLNLSSDAATSGSLKVTNTIHANGLHSEAPFATGLVSGFLTTADWTTFNSKEPAITGGTTAQYWRGDKTFQALNIAALTAVTSGAAAATGSIGEILTATQASNTATGVGATGVYGNVISRSITAGRWLVWGSAGFTQNAAVLTAGLQCGISASSSGVGISEFDTALSPALISGTSDLIMTTPAQVINISSTTTYYLNTKFTYTSGSPQHRGKITALRIG